MVRTAANHQPVDYSTTTFRAIYFTPKTLAKPNWRAATMQGFDGNIGKYVSLAYLEAEKLAF